jgi:hypothetical protein
MVSPSVSSSPLLDPIPRGMGGMATSDEEFWRRFDELDKRRVRHSRRREDALRRLSPSTSRVDDPDAKAAWREYCESVDRLEQSVAELERMVWQIK